jgi:CRISPR-associated protein Cas2
MLKKSILMEKKKAGFRKSLLNDGFTMMQYSVYMRHCASSESADAHEKRIKRLCRLWVK